MNFSSKQLSAFSLVAKLILAQSLMQSCGQDPSFQENQAGAASDAIASSADPSAIAGGGAGGGSGVGSGSGAGGSSVATISSSGAGSGSGTGGASSGSTGGSSGSGGSKSLNTCDNSSDDDDDDDLSDDAKTTLSRRFQNFLVSGNGPGSCGLNASCGTSAPACPKGYAGVGATGDCFYDPGLGHFLCFGNRLLCKSTGDASENSIVTTSIHLFAGASCPSGYVKTGVSGRDHVYGVSGNASQYSEFSVCRTTLPRGLVKAGMSVVTDLKIIGQGQRYSTAPACGAGYTSVGVIPDCVNNDGSAAKQYCSGATNFCQKLEVLQ